MVWHKIVIIILLFLMMFPTNSLAVEDTSKDINDGEGFFGSIFKALKTIGSIVKGLIFRSSSDFDFDVDVNQPTVSLMQDVKAGVSVDIRLVKGETKPVKLTITNWRSMGISSEFGDMNPTAGSRTQLYIETTCATPPGEYLHTVQGEVGTRTSVDSVNVIVTPNSYCPSTTSTPSPTTTSNPTVTPTTTTPPTTTPAPTLDPILGSKWTGRATHTAFLDLNGDIWRRNEEVDFSFIVGDDGTLKGSGKGTSTVAEEGYCNGEGTFSNIPLEINGWYDYKKEYDGHFYININNPLGADDTRTYSGTCGVYTVKPETLEDSVFIRGLQTTFNLSPEDGATDEGVSLPGYTQSHSTIEIHRIR